jgi:HSP20 family protein
MSLLNTLARRGADAATTRMSERAPVRPRFDVYEGVDELLLLADVPGAHADGVQVHVQGNELSVSARRSTAAAAGTDDWHRVFALPFGVDAAKVEAKLVDGVLQLRLPKADALRARRIEVRSA